jgi:hypothetical protein
MKLRRGLAVQTIKHVLSMMSVNAGGAVYTARNGNSRGAPRYRSVAYRQNSVHGVARAQHKETNKKRRQRRNATR